MGGRDIFGFKYNSRGIGGKDWLKKNDIFGVKSDGKGLSPEKLATAAEGALKIGTAAVGAVMAAPVIASAAGSAAGVAGNLAAGAVNIAGQGIGAAGGYVGNQLAQTFSNIAGADNKSADIGTQTPNIIVLPSAQSAPTASQMQSLDTPKTLTSTAQKTNKSSDFWFILGTVGVVAFNIFKRII